MTRLTLALAALLAVMAVVALKSRCRPDSAAFSISGLLFAGCRTTA